MQIVSLAICATHIDITRLDIVMVTKIGACQIWSPYRFSVPVLCLPLHSPPVLCLPLLLFSAYLYSCSRMMFTCSLRSLLTSTPVLGGFGCGCRDSRFSDPYMFVAHVSSGDMSPHVFLAPGFPPYALILCSFPFTR